MIEYIILGFLMHGDMSGYDMKNFMSRSTSYFYNASFGSIYPALKKLEKERCVSLVESVEDGKYRKLYSIEPEGKKRFLEWLGQPIEFNRPGYGHLIRIFFYGWLEPKRARELVADYIVRLEEELAELDTVAENIGSMAGFYELATLDFGRNYYRFTAQWCREFIKESSRLDQSGELEKRGMGE